MRGAHRGDNGAPSPPGTPRISILEGAVSVSWEASRGARSHKVLCADLDRHQVGYVDVDEGKTQVLIENVSGKYRLDIVAFNDAGASAPKQAFFDCSRSEVAKEELENAFKEWDKFRQSDPPARAERDAVRKGFGVDEGPDFGDWPGKPRTRPPGAADYPPVGRAGVDSFYFSPLGRALQSNQEPFHGHELGKPRFHEHMLGDLDRSMATDDLLRSAEDERWHSPRSTTPKKARAKFRRDDDDDEGASSRKRGPFSVQSGAADRDKSPEWRKWLDDGGAPVTPDRRAGKDEGKSLGFGTKKEAKEEDEEISQRLTARLVSATAEVVEAKRTASPRQPARFAEFLQYMSPDVPYVKPVRQLGWKGDGAAGALVLKSEVHEDVCTLRWGWRGSRNAGRGVNGYVVFVAREHERWEVAGRLQYGEASYTARHLPRNVKYNFVVFAYPINQKEEGLQGWLSQVITVTVLPGRPAPPRNVTLTIEDEAVVAKWEHAREDMSGETVVGYRIRGEPGPGGEEGVLLCEVPAACSSLSWPIKRYTGGSQISVSTVTAHRIESEYAFSQTKPAEAAQYHEPIPTPSLSLAPDGSASVVVNWQKRDPVTRYAILIKVRNKRRVQRFPVTASPAVCVLEPGAEVVAALEGDNVTTGPRVSAWSDALQLPAAVPGPPGRPCVRQSGPDLTLSWASPLDCREEVSYVIVIESQDGRRAEIHAGYTTFWSVLLDDLLVHFRKTKLRFAVIACGVAGRSLQSLWSPKVLFTPTAEWLVKDDADQKRTAKAKPSYPSGYGRPRMTGGLV
jgi:hypothetical protein